MMVYRISKNVMSIYIALPQWCIVNERGAFSVWKLWCANMLFGFITLENR